MPVLQKLHKSSNFIFNHFKSLDMKSQIILLIFFAIVFSSCSTSYKTTQTPDDVYFSPAPPQDEYVSQRNNDDRKYKDNYPDSYREYDNRFLRMKVQNRTRWSELDDWYQYDHYAISYNPTYNLNTPWSAQTYWNYYYNPYCHGSVIVNPKSTTYNKPRTVNLNTFNNLLSSNINSNPKSSGNPKTNPKIYSNSNDNNNSGFGNTLRNIFNNSNNNSGNNTGSSTSGGSEKSSGSSGSSAPVRKF